MTKLYCEKWGTTITTTGFKSNLCFDDDKALIDWKWIDMKRSKFLKYCRKNNFIIKIA